MSLTSCHCSTPQRFDCFLTASKIISQRQNQRQGIVTKQAGKAEIKDEALLQVNNFDANPLLTPED